MTENTRQQPEPKRIKQDSAAPYLLAVLAFVLYYSQTSSFRGSVIAARMNGVGCP